MTPLVWPLVIWLNFPRTVFYQLTWPLKRIIWKIVNPDWSIEQIAAYFDSPKVEKGLLIFNALKHSKIIDPDLVIGGASGYLVVRFDSPSDFNNMAKIILSRYQCLVEYYYDFD